MGETIHSHSIAVPNAQIHKGYFMKLRYYRFKTTVQYQASAN